MHSCEIGSRHEGNGCGDRDGYGDIALKSTECRSGDFFGCTFHAFQ